jgi:tetratricopeptide (TPR) repeat protein
MDRRALFRRLFALLALACLLVLAPVFAPGPTSATGHAQDDTDAEPQKTRRTPAMREQTYKKLSAARELAEAEQYADALRELDKLAAQKGLNSYERAQLYNFYGYIHFSQERFREAIRDYEQVLAQDNLPLALENGTQYTLAQLYFTVEDYDRAIGLIRRWLSQAENAGPEPYILLGQALYQKADYRAAVEPVETAIRIAAAQGDPPKEQWLLMLRLFYFELGEFDKVAEILHQLLAMNPKKEYWIQLSGIYGERDDTRKQLLAYEMAYLQGLLTSGEELVTLAQLYIQAGVPYKAGTVLENGMAQGLVEETERNYRLLSQAWTMAQEDEKAIPTLTRAAQLSTDGQMDLRLARAYANLGQWPDAVDSVRRAIDKGGLKRPDQAHVLLGIALYNLERYDQAIAAFRLASQDTRSRRAASQWISHIGSEQSRQAQLRQALGDT